MKIDYPIIKWEDVQPGDTILTQYSLADEVQYREFKVDDPSWGEVLHTNASPVHYLIDRPKPVFPEDYGTIIIAKRVRGEYFPEGIPLARQRGGYSAAYQGPMWKSFTQKVGGADNHGERQIEDWVIAKVVPA